MVGWLGPHLVLKLYKCVVATLKASPPLLQFPNDENPKDDRLVQKKQTSLQPFTGLINMAAAQFCPSRTPEKLKKSHYWLGRSARFEGTPVFLKSWLN